MTSRQAEVYSKAIDAEVLLHGGDHPAVARAHTNYGEWLLIEGDVGAARYQLDTALRIYSTLAMGVLNEDWIDAHYRVGQAIAAESRVTGSSVASRNHLLKTLSMREDFDAARALDRATATPAAPGDPVPLPTLSSNMDSTLIYSDLAERDRAAGNYKDAAMLYTKSIKLRREKFGDTSAAVGQVLLKYGETLRLSLKYAEAKTAIDEALSIYMQLYGPKHVAVTEALNAAGQIQRLLGHLQEAEALLLESLQLRREMHGDLHVSTASSLNNLAEVCREKEDFFQAINYHNLAIEAFTKSVGAEHPGTMNARGNLGVTLRRQARQSESLGQELVKQTMDYLRTQQYDADHPWRAKFDTENAMAQAEHLAAQGQTDESLELYEALINKKHIVAQINATTALGTPAKTGRLVTFTSTSPLDSASPPKKASQDVVLLTEGKVQGLLKRAHALCGRGQFVEAEGVYAATLASSRAILGIDSLYVYRCMVAHAECLTRLGRYPQAQAVLEEALQARIDLKGPDDVEVSEASYALAQVYRLCGSFDTALGLYVHAMETVAETLRKDPFSMEKSSITGGSGSGGGPTRGLNELHGRILLGLARLQTQRGLLPKSRALLTQAKESAAKTLGESHALYIDILSAEAVNHAEVGNVHEAARLQQHCLAWRATGGTTQTHASLHHLARLAFLQGDFCAASEYLEEALKLCAALFPPSSPSPSASPSSSSAPSSSSSSSSSPHPALLRLHHTKALLLISLGQYDAAHALLEATLVSSRVTFGARHAAVADSLAALGHVSLLRGLPRAALEALEQALDVYRELYSGHEAHRSTCRARLLQAEALLLMGRYPEGLESLQGLLPLCEGSFAKMGVANHLDVAAALTLLSRAECLHGCLLDEAEAHALRAGKMVAAVLESWEQPPGSLYAADALEALACCHVSRARHKMARAVLSFAAAIRAHCLPLSHASAQHTLRQALDNLALPGYYWAYGSGLEGLCDAYMTAFPETSVFAVDASILQARAVLTAAQASPERQRAEARLAAAASAEALYLQAMFSAKDALGEASVRYGLLLAEMGECAHAQGKAKFSSAAPLYKEAMDILQAAYGDSDQSVAFMEVLLRQCWLWIDAKDQEIALPALEKRVLPLLDAALGADHPTTMYARGLLGLCYNDRKRASGTELIRKSLLFFEDYPQFPFSADHVFLLNLGGYETGAKTSLLSSALQEPPLLPWCLPEDAPEAALVVYYDHNDQPIAHKVMQPETRVAEGDCVCLAGAEDWGTVGRIKGKMRQDVVTVGSLFKAPNASVEGSNSSVADDGSASTFMVALHASQKAVQVLLGRIRPNAEGVYSVAMDIAASAGFGAGQQRAGLSPADLARQQRESAARTAAAGKELALLVEEKGDEEEDGEGEVEVRSKLKELRAQREEEEVALAEVRLRKLSEEAEAMEMRALKEAEEEEVAALVKARKEAQVSLQALQAQREADASECATLAAARAGHESALQAVLDELGARREEVAQAQFELQRLVEAREAGGVVSAGVGAGVGVGEGVTASLEVQSAEGGAVEGQGETVPAVSVAAVEGDAPAPAAASIAAPSAPSSGPSAAPAPKVTEKERARTLALEAASFLSARAAELTRQGKFRSAQPLLEECVSVREKYLKNQPEHLEAVFLLAINLSQTQQVFASMPLLAYCLEQRVAAARGERSNQGQDEEGELDEAPRKVDEPVTVEIAEITQAQAQNLFALGKYPQAVHKFAAAVKMLLEACGDAHDKTARCMVQQSRALCQMARYDEAKAVAERAYAILNKLYSTRDAATALGLMARVHVGVAAGNIKEAKPLLEQCISMRKRLLHERHPLVAECYVVMGSLLLFLGQLQESAKWYGQAHDIVLEAFEVDSLAVAEVEYHLARLLQVNGKIAESTALHRVALEKRQKRLPLAYSPEEVEALKPKPKTDEELDAEADLALRIGKKVEAAPPAPPVTHSCIQDSLQCLAENCLIMGDFDEAARLLKQVGKLRREYLQPEPEGAKKGAAASKEDGGSNAPLALQPHPDLVAVYFFKAELLRMRGDLSGARPVLEVAAEMAGRLLGKAHPSFFSAQFSLAHVTAAEGGLEAAEKLYRRWLKKFREALSDDHYLYADAQGAYATCLRRLGRLDEAHEQLQESVACRRMLFSDVNPLHLSLVEGTNNLGLWSLDQLGAPPPPAVALPTEGETGTVVLEGEGEGEGAAKSAEEEEEEADKDNVELALMQEQSRMQARIAGRPDDDQSEEASLPPLDPSKMPQAPPTEQERLATLLAEGEAVEAGIEADDDEPQEPFARDGEGVPIFDNSAYADILASFNAGLATLQAHYTLPRGVGAATVFLQHPMAINLSGNMGIVRKLEHEHKLRFMSSLRKEDRALFRRRERRLLRIGVQPGAVATPVNVPGPGDAAVATQDAAAPAAAAPSEAASVSASSQDVVDDDDDDEPEGKTAAVPGMADMERAMQALEDRGLSAVHPWMVKFRSYRAVVEAPPDEMGVAKLLLEQGMELLYRGIYSAADLKLDEALSLQIDFLSLRADTSPEVAITVMLKADSALAQHRLDAAKALYMQAYFIHCKMESPACEGAARAQHGMASLLLCRGLVEDARILAESVYKARVALHGKLHPATATTQALLARCAADVGAMAEATTLAAAAMQACEELKRPAAGPDGLLYLSEARLVLGRVLLQKGELSAAAGPIKSAHELRGQALGPEHPSNADTLDALAELRLMQGKLADARKAVGQAMKIRLKTLGRLKYNSIKLSTAAAAFLDTSPALEEPRDAAGQGDDDDHARAMAGRKLAAPAGEPPSALEAFGGRGAVVDYDLASLIASTIDSIAGSKSRAAGEGKDAASVEASHLSIKEAKPTRPKGFTYRGVPITPHGDIAHTVGLRGSICLALGDLAEGREMVEGAYSLRKDVFGRRSVPTSKSLAQLGLLTLHLGVPRESLALFGMAHALRLQLLGDAHPLVAEALLSTAVVKIKLGKLDEASGALADAKRCLKQSLGAGHFSLAHVLLAEAELQLARGEYLHASSSVSKTLVTLRAAFSDVHPSVASALLVEGQVSLAMGSLDVAQVKVEQCLSQRGVFFGDDHPAVAEARYWSAHVMRAQGRSLEAKAVIESALTCQRDRLGRLHPDTLSSLTLLAYNMSDCGKYSSATPLFARAAQLLKRQLGDDCLLPSWAQLGQARCLLAEAFYPQCRELLGRIELARQRVVGASHPLVLEVRAVQAALSVRLGLLEATTAQLDDLLALRRMALGQMHPDVAHTLFALGELLHARGKLAESRSMHERCLKMRRAVLGVDHVDIVDSQCSLAALAFSTGKLEQASAMLARCLASLRMKRGSRHPSVASALLLLGRVHNQLGDLEEGRSLLLDALMLRKAAFHSCGTHPDVAEAVQALAENWQLRGCYAPVEAAVVVPSAAAVSEEGEQDVQGSKEEKDDGPAPPVWQPSAAPDSAAYGLGLSQGPANDLDEGSIVSGVSGFGNDAFQASLSVSFDPHRAPPPDGADARSVEVDSVQMSRIEDRFGYVSVEDFLDEALSADAAQSVAADLVPPPGEGSGPKKTGKQRAREEKERERQRESALEAAAAEQRARDVLRMRLPGPEEEEESFCLPLLERALDICMRLFGAEHPRTLSAQQAVAETLLSLGKLTLAHDLTLHVLVSRRRVLGDDHLETAASHVVLAEALRLMSRVYPENTAEAAEKRTMPTVERSLGPSLIEHLGSILGKVEGLKRQWPPEASSALVMLEAGRTTTDTMHPLLSPPKRRLEPRDRYLGGFMGYAFPTPKKIKRAQSQGALTRPPKTYYHDAKWLYDLAQGGMRRVLGESDAHPQLAALLFGKAELMRARRRPDLATPLYEECLSMRRRLFRASHPGIADCLQGLAEIYRVDNKLSRCVPLLDKVLEIRREAYGGDTAHPSLAEAQCSLAMVYYAQGRYLEAIPLYQQSLQTREALLGSRHIATAQTLNNYAGLLHTLGRNSEALPLYTRALDIKLEALGADHPDVACAKNNSALLLKALGRYPEARSLYHEALASQRKTFGSMHPDVAATLNNLAALEVAVWSSAGGAAVLQEAKDHYRESLEIKRKVLGLEHPACAATLNNLAGLCLSCGDVEDSRDLYEESLRLRRLAYGDDHPAVAESLNNTALLMFSQGQLSAALPLFERAIVIKAASYGDAHISTASSMHNLAVVLHRLQRFAEADAMYSRALETRMQRLGEDHGDTQKTLQGLVGLRADRDKAGEQQLLREGQLEAALGAKRGPEAGGSADSPAKRELAAAIANALLNLQMETEDVALTELLI